MVVTSPNRLGRFDVWLGKDTDPYGAARQPLHGRYALADGGWWGVGLGASREKWSWLPEAHNDFIFAILGEELGLPGTLVMLGLFCALTLVCYRIVLRSKDMFVRIATAGVMAWIVVPGHHQHRRGHRAAPRHRCAAAAGLLRRVLAHDDDVRPRHAAVVRPAGAGVRRGAVGQAVGGPSVAGRPPGAAGLADDC